MCEVIINDTSYSAALTQISHTQVLTADANQKEISFNDKNQYSRPDFQKGSLINSGKCTDFKTPEPLRQMHRNIRQLRATVSFCLLWNLFTVSGYNKQGMDDKV